MGQEIPHLQPADLNGTFGLYPEECAHRCAARACTRQSDRDGTMVAAARIPQTILASSSERTACGEAVDIDLREFGCQMSRGVICVCASLVRASS